MIELLDVSASRNDQPVLCAITTRFERGARIGILGASGSGKSTLLRMIAGSQRPDSGSVRRNARISWPLGLAAAFHPGLSGAENIAHLARINGLNADFCVAFCASFSQLTSCDPMRKYTPSMRARLAFAFSFAAPFEVYLADETTGTGDDKYRARCDAMLNARLASAGLVMTSKRASTLRRYCNRFYALNSGSLIPCPNVEIAQSIVRLSQEDSKEYARV